MNYGIPLNQRNEFVRKQLSGMSSWKVKGSVPISQVLRDAIRNKNNLQTMDIIEKYVKYLRCLKYPSSIHESQKKKKKKKIKMINQKEILKGILALSQKLT